MNPSSKEQVDITPAPFLSRSYKKAQRILMVLEDLLESGHQKTALNPVHPARRVHKTVGLLVFCKA
jgi:hypothetical protein